MSSDFLYLREAVSNEESLYNTIELCQTLTSVFCNLKSHSSFGLNDNFLFLLTNCVFHGIKGNN